MRKKITCFITVFCLILGSKGNILLESFESVTPDQGLADPVVYCFAQDQEEFLWIGSNRGLLRYDGVRIIRYSPEENTPYFPGEYVPCGYLLDDSVFYAGTYHYLCRYRDDGHFDTISLPLSGQLKNNLLLSLIKDREKEQNLWLGTEQGLIRWNSETGQAVLYLADTPIKSLFYDQEGNLWIGTDSGLFIKPAGATEFICRRKHTDNPHFLQNDVVWTFFRCFAMNAGSMRFACGCG